MLRGFHACSFLMLIAFAVTFAAPSAALDIGRFDDLDAGILPSSLLTACTLQPGTIASTSLIWTEPEGLTHAAWKIPIQSCTACPSGRLLVNSARFRLRWLGPCSAEAQVSIVGAAQGPDGCLVPDTSVVLCPPTTRRIVGTGNGTTFYTFQMAPECCVSGDAFLLVQFVGLEQCGFGGITPGLASALGTCTPCQQFVAASNIFPSFLDMCGGTHIPAQHWFSIDADCCAVTPNQDHSWGSVKTRYR